MLNTIFGVLCSLICIALLVALFRDLGYKSGVKDGYAKGRLDADNWWIGAESEADQARRQIWREEAQP
jgi:hypothetical protein